MSRGAMFHNDYSLSHAMEKSDVITIARRKARPCRQDELPTVPLILRGRGGRKVAIDGCLRVPAFESTQIKADRLARDTLYRNKRYRTR